MRNIAASGNEHERDLEHSRHLVVAKPCEQSYPQGCLALTLLTKLPRKMSLRNDPKTTKDFSEVAKDEPGDALPFYEAEGEVLALRDKLQEMKLERALLEARAKNRAPESEHAIMRHTPRLG